MSMPDISIEVSRKVQAIGQEMQSRAVRASRVLKNTELQVLRGRGRGRVYKKAYKNAYYAASAPGSPPAVRTGRLRNSFRPVGSVSTGALSVTAAIETDTHYAGYLEHGTRKMAARPYVEKIKQQAEPEVTRIFSAPYNV